MASKALVFRTPSRLHQLGQALRYLTTGGVVFGVLALITRWGGTPRTGPLLWLGIAAVGLLVCGFAGLTWWLFASPLAHSAQVASHPRSRQLRQGMALVVACAGTLFVVGGLWDEVWHRRFGNFGNDFLWPPHMLLYLSIASIFGCAIAGLLLVVRGQGCLRQRFRSEPAIGLLGLCAGYMLTSLPADELWHRIYGKDLTAWSLPHILVMVDLILVLSSGVALQRSLLPEHGWRGLGRLAWREVIIVWLCAMSLSIALQVGITEWQNLTTMRQIISSDVFQSAFWQRPEWLYPVIICGLAILSGSFGLHVVRRPGTATLIGLTTLGLRLILLHAFAAQGQDVNMNSTGYFLVLPAMVALDGFYLLRRRWPTAFGALVAGGVSLTVSLPVIGATMLFPRISSQTVPSMIAFGLLIALLGGWFGERAAHWVRTIHTRPAAAEQIELDTAIVDALPYKINRQV